MGLIKRVTWILLTAVIGIAINNIAFAEKNEFAKQTESLRKLNKTPLIREENYNEYLQVDKELNSSYKSLSKLLDKDSRAVLKKTQLEWIKWRDDKCSKLQEGVECGTVGCYGLENDSCIIQVTDDRTEELQKFKLNIKDAISNKFEFSRKNKYVDHDYLKD